MRRIFALLLLAFSLPAQAERIKDMVSIEGVRANQLAGYGIVVGLAGTGDDNLPYTVQSLKNAVSRLGLALPPGLNPAAKNAAAVFVTAELPAFAKIGQRMDVTISAIGKAKSIRGGTLLLTFLQGADGEVYASAQGNVAVGGLGVEGADGSSLTVNIPSAGRIAEGGIVEREVASHFRDAKTMRLDLKRPDYTTAVRIAEAINDQARTPIATPMDSTSIEVIAPAGAEARVRLLSAIENINVQPAAPLAQVIINARTGTVVISEDVRVRPVAVAHGSLRVQIQERLNVSQPNAFGQGQTTVTPQSSLSAEEKPAMVHHFSPGASLRKLVDALNALGATSSDIVAILEAIHKAGALNADLVII